MHSAGPWKLVQECVDPEWHIVTAEGGRMIANVHIEAGNATDTANAAMVVAAPDLLAACELVLESIDRNLAADCLPETRLTLRNAIAAAKGGA